MIKYPIEFSAKTISQSGIQADWISRTEEGLDGKISIPPVFNGPGKGFSPEDLFHLALTNCFVASFKVYAENSHLEYESLSVESKLVVDLNEARSPVMKEFFLDAKIKKPSNPEMALHLAKRASELGFILNSVTTVCHFSYENV